MLSGTIGWPPKVFRTVMTSGCKSPAHTRRSRLAPSHRCACMHRCSVRRPVCQMAVMRSSLHANLPTTASSRISVTARAPIRSTNVPASGSSIRAKRKPVEPTSWMPAHGTGVTLWWIAWSWLGSPSVSAIDSPKVIFRLTGLLPVVWPVTSCNPPWSSRPKSSSSAGASGLPATPRLRVQQGARQTVAWPSESVISRSAPSGGAGAGAGQRTRVGAT